MILKIFSTGKLKGERQGDGSFKTRARQGDGSYRTPPSLLFNAALSPSPSPSHKTAPVPQWNESISSTAYPPVQPGAAHPHRRPPQWSPAKDRGRQRDGSSVLTPENDGGVRFIPHPSITTF